MTESDNQSWVSIETKLSDEKAKIMSTANVLEGARLYDLKMSQGQDFFEWFVCNKIYTNCKVKKQVTSRASKLLRIAWQTELASQLPFQLDDPIMKQASIQIFPVQAYYAVFNSIRALTEVLGGPIDSHHKIKKYFSSNLSALTSGLWSTKMFGDPEDLDNQIFTNLSVIPSNFNPASAGHEPENYVYSLLKTARRFNLKKRRETWLESTKERTAAGERFKNLPSKKRIEHLESEYGTTVLDYMYKLRCDTNYNSIDEFSVDLSGEHLNMYHDGLNYIMQSGLFMIEAQISNNIGKQEYKSEFENWSSKMIKNGSWAVANPKKRANLILEI